LLAARYILAAALLASSAAAAGDLTFEAEAPPACESPAPLRLLLKDVELPRSRAVTIRAYAKQTGREESFIGLFAVMAASVNAVGNRKLPQARVTATPAFRRSIETGSGKQRLSIVLRPFAGKAAMNDLNWSVRAVEWACH
jgi:hypothetical protein